jgi:hypothetical protein
VVYRDDPWRGGRRWRELDVHWLRWLKVVDERDNPWAEPDDSEAERSGPEDWRRQEEPEAGTEGPDQPSSGDSEEGQAEERFDQPDATGNEASSSDEMTGDAAAGPSLGPHTDLEAFQEGREESLEKAAHASDTDAMGLDKRREIVGGTYGMTRAKLAVLYTTVVVVIAAAAVGLYLLAKDLDQPPEKVNAEAPWAEENAPQRSPGRIQ